MIALGANVMDPDTLTVPTFAWSKITGPGTVTFSTPTSKLSNATFSSVGNYTLRLFATDGGVSVYDDIDVNVINGNSIPFEQFQDNAITSKTVYVSVSGSDTLNDGTSAATAFQTIAKALSVAQPGEKILVGPGTYAEAGKGVSTVRSGSMNQRIVIDGQNQASIKQFNFKHQYITLKNMNISGVTQPYTQHVLFDLNAHNNILANCTVDAKLMAKVAGIGFKPGPLKPFDVSTPSDNLIVGNTVKNVLASTLILIMGDRNVIRGNRLLDSGAVDFFRVFGQNALIQGNYCVNNYNANGYGNHPDFIQTFGNNGHGSQGHVIENNIVKDIESGQITQLEGNLVPEIRDWTFRNNQFIRIAMQASCTIPEVKYYNNVFYKCNTVNGGHVLSFGKRSYASMTTSVDSDVAIRVDAANTGWVNYAHGAQAINNVFLANGDGTPSKGWYGFALEMKNVIADYNYVGRVDYSPVSEDSLKRFVGSGTRDGFKWWETNGINGGNPGFTNVNGDDFSLLGSSLLINQATPLSDVPSDILGHPRSVSTPDIGAYEY